MWHASVAGRFGQSVARQFALAERALAGVGDVTLGEWREVGEKAVHVRRRLTPGEMAAGGIATVVDVRRTEEHAARVRKMRPFLPPDMATWPDAAFP